MEEQPCCFAKKWIVPVITASAAQSWRTEVSSAQKKVYVNPIANAGGFNTIPASVFPARARPWTFPNMIMKIFPYKNADTYAETPDPAVLPAGSGLVCISIIC